jgi:kynurenine formamidase
MHAGIGTHMDAPSHLIPGGKCIHDFQVDELCMPCFVIDVSSNVHERYRLTPEDIHAFEKKYEVISQGSCIMIKTGWEKFWHDPKKYNNNHIFPSISLEAAYLLLERGVSSLGIDTLSPDCPENGFKVHQAFLGSGKILIENVANLDSMPPIGGYVMLLPIKIKDGTEAPMRLIGLMSKGLSKNN